MPSSRRGLLHNGTICYVDTGSRHIGITADHVYRQYLKDLEEHENVQAQFGGSTIYAEKRLIDRDPELTSQRSTCQQSS